MAQAEVKIQAFEYVLYKVEPISTPSETLFLRNSDQRVGTIRGMVARLPRILYEI